VVMNERGVPVGVCEVKKPGRTIINSPVVHGQIYDYMLRLRSFHGLKHVFGIVSTYEQWRLYWLDDCCSAATATDLAAASSSSSSLPLAGMRPAASPVAVDDASSDDEAEPRGRAPEPLVRGHQPAAQERGEREPDEPKRRGIRDPASGGRRWASRVLATSRISGAHRQARAATLGRKSRLARMSRGIRCASISRVSVMP